MITDTNNSHSTQNKTNNQIHIIYPPSVRWDIKKQRPHHILKHLSQKGYTVHFVAYAVGEERNKDFKQISDNFFVYWKQTQAVDTLLKIKQENPEAIFVLYANHPAAYEWQNKLPERFFGITYYDYIDDFEEWRKGEDVCLRESDIVGASAKILVKKALVHRSQVEYIGNGCDFEHFRQAENRLPCPELDNITEPIIGYFGALAQWWDFDISSAIANNFGFAKFVIIGNLYSGVFQMPKRTRDNNNNVIYLGEKDYQDLPNYLSRFDVCIIPFNAKSDIIKATNPIKVWEYFASGKPVVITDMPEISNMPGLSVGEDKNDFIKKLCEAVRISRAGGDGLGSIRQEVARKEDWEHKAEQINVLFQAKINEKFGKSNAFSEVKISNDTKMTPEIIIKPNKIRLLAPSRKYAVRDFVDGFNEVGHDGKWLSDLQNREDSNYVEARLREEIEQFRPDIILHEGISLPKIKDYPQILKKLQSEFKNKYDWTFKIAYWSTEANVHSDITLDRGNISDVVFCTAEESLTIYSGGEESPKPTFLMPFAANTKHFYSRQHEKQYACEVCFVGANYGHERRVETVKKYFIPLSKKPEINFAVYGSGWCGEKQWSKPNTKILPPTFKGEIARRELPWLYSSSAIVLGVNIIDTSETHTSFRPYEALACGAFHLTRYDKATENIFGASGENLVTFEGAKDFFEKIDFYLENHDERKRIAESGRQFVLENHTYRHRAQGFVKNLTESGIINGL